MAGLRGTLAALHVVASFALSGSRLLTQEPGVYDHYQVHDPDGITQAEFAARRAEVLRRMPSASAMVVRSAEIRTRSNDVDYTFRQRNSLLYLSGMGETGCALVLARAAGDSSGAFGRTVLFVDERDPAREIWAGPMMGVDVARRVTGIDDVRPFRTLGRFLDSLLPTVRTLYYDDWAVATVNEPLLDTTINLERNLRFVLKSRYGRLAIKGAGEILHDMRCVKSPAEIELMRKAVAATIAGHRSTIRSGRPGIAEYELEATMEYEFARHGAESPGYPSIVGSGPNACILHYESNRRRTAAGDLVLMDCGAEYRGYSADITRTFPVSGKFTPEQRTLYDLVLKAQEAGIDACRPGNFFIDTHRRALEVLGEGLAKLGIIDDVSEVARYFPHGTSHYLGLDVHDVGNLAARLQPGMILTVEPGIYIPAGSPCDRKWWNIGIRIEDDILVTPSGPENLSADLERSADQIERLMKGGD